MLLPYGSDKRSTGSYGKPGKDMDRQRDFWFSYGSESWTMKARLKCGAGEECCAFHGRLEEQTCQFLMNSTSRINYLPSAADESFNILDTSHAEMRIT